MNTALQITPASRQIVHQIFGRRHGPVTRLVSPSDLGELIKPFVFLDHVEVAPSGKPLFGYHPHSGIATLTAVLDGTTTYEETTGEAGDVHAGGIEWMRAGGGVWHTGGVKGTKPIRAFQLWVALPPALENAPAESQYLDPADVQQEGPVRVLLGQYGSARSVIRAPEGIHYFHVRLSDRQRWSYQPPSDHRVAWLAVDQGQLDAGTPVAGGELAIFDDSPHPIDIVARGDTSFVIGTAVPHPYPLELGYYSVHTSQEALARGEDEIRRLGQQLKAEGRL
jgi:redox-sensitive bicupin YhaK (pirin superfamily)